MRAALLAAVLLVTASVAGAEVRVEGEVVAGYRGYPGPLPTPDDGLVSHEVDVAGRLDLLWRSGRTWRAKASPRLLYDPIDPARWRWVPFEAWVEARTGPWRLRVGRQTVSWGVSDTFNPSDVVATRDFGSDFLDPDRSGDWMATVVYSSTDWAFEGMAIPWVEGARFPSARSRWGLDAALRRLEGLRPDAVTLNETPHIPEDARELSLAGRLRATVGPADLYLFGHTGTSRAPVLTATRIGFFGSADVQATYLPLHLVGAETQVALGDWLLKASWGWRDQATQDSLVQEQIFAEGALREQYSQGVVGVEWLLAEFLGGAGDLDVTAEYLWNNGSSETSLSTYQVLQSNLALAVIYLLGDWSDTRIEVGWLDSLVRQEGALTARVSRRLAQSLRGEVFADILLGPDGPPSPFYFFRENDRAGIRLSYGF